MEIVENLAAWETTFREGWLRHCQETGTADFKLYTRPRNLGCPMGKGIDLSKSRLILISTAGGYLKHSQARFDDENIFGDYTIRTFPTSTPFADLSFAQTHYDHTAVAQDPQVLLPLRHLEEMVDEGIIGDLASTVVSFSGYMPDISRVVHELIPAIWDVVDQERAQAALLVPA